MKYGRVDVSGPDQCPEEGRLPGTINLTLVIWLCFLLHIHQADIVIDKKVTNNKKKSELI